MRNLRNPLRGSVSHVGMSHRTVDQEDALFESVVRLGAVPLEGEERAQLVDEGRRLHVRRAPAGRSKHLCHASAAAASPPSPSLRTSLRLIALVTLSSVIPIPPTQHGASRFPSCAFLISVPQPQGDYIELHRKRFGYRLDHHEREYAALALPLPCAFVIAPSSV